LQHRSSIGQGICRAVRDKLPLAHMANYPSILREDNHMAKESKIKVLHLVTRMNVGGVAVLIDNLLANISPIEFDVVLAFGACENPEKDYLASRKVSYKFIRIPKFHKSIKLADDFFAFLEICKIIRNFRPDVIHTHTSKAGLYGRIAGFLFCRKARRVHTFHGHLLIGYFSKIKLKIVVTIERILGQISFALIAMGTQVKKDLVDAKIGSNKIFKVLYPGLISPTFPSREVARRELGLTKDAIYCIYIGRLTQIKRPERVLQVAELTNSQSEKVNYLVVGDGEMRGALEAMAKSNELPVRFFGWREDIPTLLAAADILILTSDNEAVALTLIEAAQAGLPVVTTAAGSVRDIAIDGQTGFVTDFDFRNLADSILKLAHSSELREQFGQSGLALANEKFSIKRMVEDHQDFYKDILSIA
jgi:glycosyltransferase involved in cell wall biosynthesis